MIRITKAYRSAYCIVRRCVDCVDALQSFEFSLCSHGWRFDALAALVDTYPSPVPNGVTFCNERVDSISNQRRLTEKWWLIGDVLGIVHDEVRFEVPSIGCIKQGRINAYELQLFLHIHGHRTGPLSRSFVCRHGYHNNTTNSYAFVKVSDSA